VIVISCALRERDSFRVWSLGETDEAEGPLIQRFFEGIEKYTPQLVSWNGSGFDLPVLHYRGLIHGVIAARYWETGEGDYRDSRDFKWNNYISRYHARHLDLMDLLALYQGRANAPLDDLARLMGLPGKLGMAGAGVWDAYQACHVDEIRNYCEVDVANTYLVFLRFQLMRGALDQKQFAAECELVRNTLGKSPGPHWQEFLMKWRR
jgi:3'-5' exonuclease